MQNSTYYNLKLVEGTDIVNPLTVDKPNYETIDGVMHLNSTKSVGTSTEVVTSGVHAITRSNTDCDVFRYTAVDDWGTNDTMTIDGQSVSVYLPNGTRPTANCYVTNTEVLAIKNGNRVTLYCQTLAELTAGDVSYDNSSSGFTATNVQAGIDEVSTEAGFSLAANGTTVTLRNKKGTTISTITTKDTQPPAIVNNLTSTSTTSGLSANMGKTLKDTVDGKLNLSGGTMTGNLNMGAKALSNVASFTGRTAGCGVNNVSAIAGYSATEWLPIQCGALSVRNQGNTAFTEVHASKFTQESSRKYKENIEDMTDEYAKKLLQLRPVSYDYINKEQGTNCYGLIAEEVAEIEEYPVSFRNGEAEGIDYSTFVPQLIKMIQILQQEIDDLKADR